MSKYTRGRHNGDKESLELQSCTLRTTLGSGIARSPIILPVIGQLGLMDETTKFLYSIESLDLCRQSISTLGPLTPRRLLKSKLVTIS